MLPKVHIIWMLISNFMSITDCTVNLEHSGTSGDIVTCGSAFKFTCTINPLTSTMTWFKDSAILTQCTNSTDDDCLVSTNGTYTFTSLLAQFQYYIDISALALTDGTTFKCNDGSLESVKTLNVIVEPTSASQLTEPGNGNTGNFVVTTNCVYNKDDVTIEWTTFVDGTTEYTAADFTVQNTTDANACSSGNCGGSGAGTVISTLTLTEENGTDVKFRAVITHTVSGTKVTLTSTTTYKIEEGDDCECECCIGSLKCWIFTIIIGYIVCAVISTAIVTGICYKYKLGMFAENISIGKRLIRGLVIIVSLAMTIIGAVVLCILCKCGILTCRKGETRLSKKRARTVLLECPFPNANLPGWIGPHSRDYTIEGTAGFNPALSPDLRSRLSMKDSKDLEITNLEDSDSGSYKCSVTGTGEHTITLTVAKPRRQCRENTRLSEI